MKIKILHVITGLNLGGAETMLYKLLSNMDTNQFSNVVISMTDEGVYGEKIRKLGIQVYCLNFKKGISFFKPFLIYKKIITHEQPNIVQSWMYHANVFTTLSKPFVFKHKLVHNVRAGLSSFKHFKLLTKLIIYINGILSRFSSAVINNSKISQLQHHSLGFDKSKDCYIPNGFDPKSFHPNFNKRNMFNKVQGLSDNFKTIGLLARFHPVKNHEGFLIVASKLILRTQINFRFLLAGSNCDENNKLLVDLIKKYNLCDHVILFGEVDSFEFLTQLDVFLLTSLSENFPNVVGEAMFCGIPPVVTNVGDCQAIVQEYGFVAQSKDYEELYNCCISALNCNKKQKEQMVSYVRTKYSIDSITTQYEDLYKRLHKLKV